MRLALSMMVCALLIGCSRHATPALVLFCHVGDGPYAADVLTKLPNGDPVLVHFYGLTVQQQHVPPSRFKFWKRDRLPPPWLDSVNLKESQW